MMNALRCILPLACLALGACGTLDALQMGHDDQIYGKQAQAAQAYDAGADARAETLLQGILRVSPSDAENWFRLGNLYARTDRPDLAAEAFRKSLMLRVDDARVWHNLAVVRLRQAQAATVQASALAATDPALYEKTTRLAEQLQNVLNKQDAPSAAVPQQAMTPAALSPLVTSETAPPVVVNHAPAKIAK